MQFILKAFYEIEGLGAASGLVYQYPQLYLISDYSSYLYCYDVHTQQLDKMALFANRQEFLPKPEKFDFEAIVEHDHALFLFGSGSTRRRNTVVRYEIADLQAGTEITLTPAQFDLSVLYQKFKHIAQLSEDELNIEGVICQQHAQWLFFQRGNGVQAQSGIFIVQGDIFQGIGVTNSHLQNEKQQGKTLDASHPVKFVPLQLPVVNQVPSGFTDAVLVDQTVYFLATAENSSSTYNDGEVLGSYIGRMDLTTTTIQDIELISTHHKFEGLTLYQQTTEKLEFLLCEDNDTEQLNSTIYKLTLPLES